MVQLFRSLVFVLKSAAAVFLPEAMAVVRVQNELSSDDLIARIRDVRDGDALSPELATALLACEGDAQEELLAPRSR